MPAITEKWQSRCEIEMEGRALFRKSEFRFCLDNFLDKLLWTEVAW